MKGWHCPSAGDHCQAAAPRPPPHMHPLAPQSGSGTWHGGLTALRGDREGVARHEGRCPCPVSPPHPPGRASPGGQVSLISPRFRL